VKLNLRLILPSAALASVLAGGFAMNHTTVLAATQASPAATHTPLHGACGQNVPCVIAFGNDRISDRVLALQKFIDRVNAHKHLSITQSSALVSSANSSISSLQTLQAQLDKETTITAARADVKSIYTQFRIFAEQLPRDYGTLWSDVLSNVQADFTSKESNIQQLIQKAGSPGNTTQLYQDLVAKVSDAGTQISNAEALLPNLVPANYPNQSTKQQLRTDLHTAHEDLKAARADLKQIIAALKAAHGGSSATTPTPGAGS